MSTKTCYHRMCMELHMPSPQGTFCVHGTATLTYPSPTLDFRMRLEASPAGAAQHLVVYAILDKLNRSVYGQLVAMDYKPFYTNLMEVLRAPWRAHVGANYERRDGLPPRQRPQAGQPAESSNHPVRRPNMETQRPAQPKGGQPATSIGPPPHLDDPARQPPHAPVNQRQRTGAMDAAPVRPARASVKALSKSKPPPPPSASSGSDTETSWPSEDPPDQSPTPSKPDREHDGQALLQYSPGHGLESSFSEDVTFSMQTNPAGGDPPRRQPPQPEQPSQPPATASSRSEWFSVAANFADGYTLEKVTALLGKIIHELLEQTWGSNHPQPSGTCTILPS